MRLYDGRTNPVEGFCISKINGVCARKLPLLVLVTRPPDVMQNVSVAHEIETSLVPVKPLSPAIVMRSQWRPPSSVLNTAGSFDASPAR